MITRSIPAGAALLLGLALGGCSAIPGGSESGLPLPLAPRIYVGSDLDSATMINITSGGKGFFAGTFNAKNQGDAPISAPATITVAGGQLTIDLKMALGGEVTFSGTMQDGNIHLQVPQTDGTIEDYILMPGSVADYNRDIIDMNL